MFLYRLGLFFYTQGVFLYSFFNKKARLLKSGQKETLRKLKGKPTFSKHDQVIWVHVASLGEFEQARPIIENIKNNFPQKKILLSFFSPSGYEIRKEYALADEVVYMPFDSKKNAAAFIAFYKPEFAIVVKYEFWYYYFKTCKEQRIPLLSVSTILRPKHIFFRKKNEYTNVLSFVTHFFVQNKETQQLLLSKGYKNTTLSGDTRFDRVIKLREEQYDIKDIRKWTNNKQTIVLGSLWKEDLKVLKEFIKSQLDVKYIIAPHEVDDQTVAFVEQELSGLTCKYSKELDQSKPVLIIDSIGLLMGIYSIAGIAYVGGAFGKGLHNILEPATFGLPVVFGPHYEKFQEAKDLIKLGGAFSVQTENDAKRVLLYLLENEEERIEASKISSDYVTDNAGATAQIMKHLKDEIKL